MKKTRNGDLNADLIITQYKLDKMTKFMEIKSINPKLKQSEIARGLKISSSTLQRNRREMNMLSPYRIPSSSSTSHKRESKTSNTNFDDVKITSNDLKMTSKEPITNNRKNYKGVMQKMIIILMEVFLSNRFFHLLIWRTFRYLYGVSRLFAQFFLSHSTKKFCWGTLRCIRNFRVSKNFMHQRGGRGYQDFPSKNFCLTVPKT